jgi:hypothetical protein
MSITGNLKTMQLAELLQWLGQGSKSGTLVIDNGTVEKRIFFNDGRIVSSASTDPREYLGHFLVSYGFITEDELSKAVAMQEQSKMLLGKILTSIGAIAEEDLQRLLRQKAEEAVYDVFSWTEGEFRFLDGELPAHTMVPMSLEVTSIVLEGVQRIDEWQRLRDAIPSNKAIPVSVTDLLDDPKLSAGARKILELVDDDRTIEEIQIQSHSSEYRVSKILFEQMQKGKLKIVRPRWNTAPEGAPDGQTKVHAEAVGAEELTNLAKQLVKQKHFEKGLRYLRAARSLEPDSKAIQKMLQKGEEIVTTEVAKAGVVLEAVPKLERQMTELTGLNLSAQEGFVLTRINGQYDIASIVKISPIPQVDALVVFYRLLQAGHISLQDKK